MTPREESGERARRRCRRPAPSLLALLVFFAPAFAQDEPVQQAETPGIEEAAQALEEAAQVLGDAAQAEEAEDELSVVEHLHAAGAEAIRLAEGAESDADLFYLEELQPVLRTRADQLSRRLGGWGRVLDPIVEPETPDAEGASPPELHEELRVLYRLRLETIPHLSPPEWRSTTGLGRQGLSELRDEIGFVLLGVQVEAYSIARDQEELALDALQENPLQVLGMLVEIGIALVVFRWWRKWAPARLEASISWLLRRRPRKRRHTRCAEFLWYLRRVRSPLEWLLLVGTVFDSIRWWLPEFLEILWPVALWLLLARFAILLLDAIARRGAVGRKRDTSDVRLRSLRLVVGWLVLLSLGDDLIETLAGQGTLHAWLWFFFQLASVPVAVLLVVWWRPHVFYRLGRIRPQTPFLTGLLARQKGLESYFATAIGSGYLAFAALQHWLIRRVAGFEEGRRALATFAHIEAVRLQERYGELEGTAPIDEALRRQLVEIPSEPVQSYAAPLLERLVGMVEQGRTFAAVLIGERGMGKSYFLRQLAARVDGGAIFVDCPPGEFDRSVEALAQAVGTDVPTLDAIGERLQERQARFVAFDDAHHLVRPRKGGQRGLDELAVFARKLPVDILWLGAVDGATWQFVQRARMGRSIYDQRIALPPWTEEQLAELVTARCTALGIEPDYSHLVLPTRFDEGGTSDPAERNRVGFFRALWMAADGNPEVAVRLFADSLVVDEDGRVLVRLFTTQSTRELADLHLNVRLVLRFVAMSENCSQEDLEAGLRLKHNIVEGALRLSLLRNYIEEHDGRYRLTWDWFRTITRWLAGQNLLARSRPEVTV